MFRLIMELSLKKENKVTYPTKTSINFISNVKQKENRMAVILFVVFLLFLAVFTKFGVLDPLARVNEAERAYRVMESEVNTYKDQLKDYEDVQNHYNEIVGTFLTETEASFLDRTDIIKMVDEDIKANVDIKSISISGNTVRITTDVSTMDNISSIVNTLLGDSRNSYVNVSTTKADRDSNDEVYADIMVVYSGVVE